MSTRKTYAAGTPVLDIKEFDRSQHVEFRCVKHPECVYFSKDPRISTWFCRSEEHQCRCKDLSGFETLTPYTPGNPTEPMFLAPRLFPTELMIP